MSSVPGVTSGSTFVDFASAFSMRARLLSAPLEQQRLADPAGGEQVLALPRTEHAVAQRDHLLVAGARLRAVAEDQVHAALVADGCRKRRGVRGVELAHDRLGALERRERAGVVAQIAARAAQPHARDRDEQVVRAEHLLADRHRALGGAHPEHVVPDLRGRLPKPVHRVPEVGAHGSEHALLDRGGRLELGDRLRVARVDAERAPARGHATRAAHRIGRRDRVVERERAVELGEGRRDVAPLGEDVAADLVEPGADRRIRLLLRREPGESERRQRVRVGEPSRGAARLGEARERDQVVGARFFPGAQRVGRAPQGVGRDVFAGTMRFEGRLLEPRGLVEARVGARRGGRSDGDRAGENESECDTIHGAGFSRTTSFLHTARPSGEASSALASAASRRAPRDGGAAERVASPPTARRPSSAPGVRGA
jgi:hypothetical protein